MASMLQLVIQADGVLCQCSTLPISAHPWAQWLVKALQHHASVELLIHDAGNTHTISSLFGGADVTCAPLPAADGTVFIHDPTASSCVDAAGGGGCIHVVGASDPLLTTVVPGLPLALRQQLFTNTTPDSLPAPRLDIPRTPVTAESFIVQHDPKVFLMRNDTSVCYINALVQGILRCHTWTRHYLGQSVVAFGDRIERTLGANRQHDVHEGLMVITDDVIYTPSPVAHPPSAPDTTSPPQPQPTRSTSSVVMATRDADVWCMTIIPSSHTPDAQTAMDAAFEARDDIGNGRYLQLEKPSAATTCMLLHVSRNTDTSHGKSGLPLVATRTIAVPTDTPGKFTLMGLRAMVVHMGRDANFGHYATLFFRDDGRAWWASDCNVVEVKPQQQLDYYLRDMPARNNALLMYDVVAPSVQ